MPKRIILLCDGTGQSAARGEHSVHTNVTRFGQALRHDGGVQQLIFYQSGIGTQDLDQWSKMLSSGLGYGLEDNVADAYLYLVLNYEPGDEIFIFGFSRGAFTARVLANFVARVGIFRKLYSWEIKRAFAEYRKGSVEFENYLVQVEKDIKKHDGKDAEGPRRRMASIKVVGCWDTVASVGVPNYIERIGWSNHYGYLDGSLAKGIENAFHALALDEYRLPFTPTMWFLPTDKAVAKTINLKQTWFPGAHTNVGGGYADQALADLTLSWMVDLCRPYLDFSEGYINDTVVFLNHYPGKPSKPREAQAKKDGAYDYKCQPWGTGVAIDSYKGGSTWTKQSRTPGEYAKDEKTVGATNERMHSSVRARWDANLKPEWRPRSLKNFDHETTSDGGVDWVKKDYYGKVVCRIPEEPFTTSKDAFEWKIRYEPIDMKRPGAERVPRDKDGYYVR